MKLYTDPELTLEFLQSHVLLSHKIVHYLNDRAINELDRPDTHLTLAGYWILKDSWLHKDLQTSFVLNELLPEHIQVIHQNTLRKLS